MMLKKMIEETTSGGTLFSSIDGWLSANNK
jgi:hypothetical protein